MKKLLLLFTISLLVLSCKQKPSKDPALVALMKSKVIPNPKADAMKSAFKHLASRPAKQTNYDFHWDVYQNVIDLNGDENLYIVPIVYGGDDEKEYREAWGIAPGDPAGHVVGYSSFIIQSGTGTYYYNFVKICPPPDPCP